MEKMAAEDTTKPFGSNLYPKIPYRLILLNCYLLPYFTMFIRPERFVVYTAA